MASGFFAILDDIAALMDDVAVASKIATKKTAGILGDDLAVNAEKATGFLASREVPILMKIMKSSFINKVIIIPIVFILQIFLPIAIKVILVIGGLYLAYEGVEKIVEYLFYRAKKGAEVIQEIEDESKTGEEIEKAKIKSAVMTDFILSVEIIIIALSAVFDKSIGIQIATVSVVALIATVGVYGIVALIVRMDDLGYQIIKKSNGNGLGKTIGAGLVNALPIIIKCLAVVGTIALLLVSGGIFAHNIDVLHHTFEWLPDTLRELIFGSIAGLIMVVVITGVKKIIGALFPKK